MQRRMIREYCPDLEKSVCLPEQPRFAEWIDRYFQDRPSSSIEDHSLPRLLTFSRDCPMNNPIIQLLLLQEVVQTLSALSNR
jgi:hypothetical protein